MALMVVAIALVVAALEVVDRGVATLKGRNPMKGYISPHSVSSVEQLHVTKKMIGL